MEDRNAHVRRLVAYANLAPFAPGFDPAFAARWPRFPNEPHGPGRPPNRDRQHAEWTAVRLIERKSFLQIAKDFGLFDPARYPNKTERTSAKLRAKERVRKAVERRLAMFAHLIGEIVILDGAPGTPAYRTRFDRSILRR